MFQNKFPPTNAAVNTSYPDMGAANHYMTPSSVHYSGSYHPSPEAPYPLQPTPPQHQHSLFKVEDELYNSQPQQPRYDQQYYQPRHDLSDSTKPSSVWTSPQQMNRSHLPSALPSPTLPSNISFNAPAPIQLPMPTSTGTGPLPADARFFNPTEQLVTLLSANTLQPVYVQILSKVDRGFFMTNREWTCYRRNYFQLSTSFLITTGEPESLPLEDDSEAGCRCLVRLEDGSTEPVRSFSIGLSSHSSDGKHVRLVQHTPKRDKGPQTVPQRRPIRTGRHFGAGLNGHHTLAVFERVQFKCATANNGKRRAAQQYFILNLELFATTESGKDVKVATIQSQQLMVRGRSPGHYADAHVRAPFHPISYTSSSAPIVPSRYTAVQSLPPPPSPLSIPLPPLGDIHPHSQAPLDHIFAQSSDSSSLPHPLDPHQANHPTTATSLPFMPLPFPNLVHHHPSNLPIDHSSHYNIKQEDIFNPNRAYPGGSQPLFQ
jgi:hypothetical protein